ncbi:hypothetical protein BC829DRAFT_171026 [Chytridium lagenaria]|nr:hypothetical protein BC829DRAFT_171026 [Chytridium lagenaria]
MREWSQYLRLWGQENFTAVIDTTLSERKEKNKLMRSFLGRIYALEGRPQFNLRGFEAACKNRNPKFDLQAFCDTLANLPPVESDSFEQCFEAAGIEIDPQSPEYKELLVTLFGDIDVAPAAAREWRHFLRTVGSDWSVLSLWTHLDQRQQVEGAVKQFVTDTTSLTADASSKKKRTIRLTLRAFIERCQNLEQSWRSDITFDLRVFLEKLTDMQGDVNFGSIVAVLKACG